MQETANVTPHTMQEIANMHTKYYMQEFANMQTNRLLSCAHTARLHVPLETGREINRDQHGTPYGTNAQTNKLLPSTALIWP